MKYRNKNNIGNSGGNKARVVVAIAAFLTAIAIAVTCIFCFEKLSSSVTIDSVDAGEVTTSTTYNNKTGDLSAAGTITNGDVLNYAYTGGVVSVTLPKGEYAFTIYGAQGGSADDQRGGYGGVTTGSYIITATSQTIYICIGGQGSTVTANTTTASAGGYNGGGAGAKNGSNTSATQSSGGGGGATHIAITTNRGVLSAYSSYQSEILMVAGGGGGGGVWKGGTNSWSAGGDGGGTTGGTATNGAGYSAAGATQTTGNAFGQGGTGIHVDNGGGGGGWWGGVSQLTSGDAYICGGGGGSGYVNTSLLKAGASTNTSTHTGNGSATITVVSVNQAPVSKSPAATVTGKVRGSTVTTAISVDTIATDPDATKTTLYFTDGTSSNYDTFTTTANTRLYLDSACTKLATDYISWSWGTDKRTLNITAYKKYPRNGVDGSTLDGRLTLYCKVRDSFGTATTRGVGTITFYLTIPVNTVSLKSTTVATTINGKSSTYVLGTSTTSTTPSGTYVPTTSNIYNPNGTGIYTAVMPEPVRMGESFVVKAADLLSGVCTYDQVVIGLSSTSNVASSVQNRKYKINELDAGSGVTAYNNSKGLIANTFTQLTFTCLSPDPAYQVFRTTLYVVEKATAYGSSYPNVVPAMTTYTFDIVFSMQNTRPTVSTTTSNVVDVAVGETRSLSLSTYFTDLDGAITSTTHTITEIVVPSNEFIQISSANETVAQSGVNAGYYNLGNATTSTYSTTAQGDKATGFNTGIVYNLTDASKNGSNTTREAFMRISYANDTVTVTGLRSSYSQYESSRATKPGHFYVLLHIRDQRDTEDNGIWLPLAFRIGTGTSYTPTSVTTAPNAATTTSTSANVTEQTQSSVKPTASGSVGDSFYFAPMAIGYGGIQVVGKYKDDSGVLTSTGLQPLALDGDNYTTTSGAASRSGKLNELLTLSSLTTAESVVRSVSDAGVTVAGDGLTASNRYVQAEIIDIYIEKALFATSAYNGGRVIGGSGSNDTTNGFYYAGLDGTERTENGTAYYVVRGIKLTLKTATMNRYFYASAAVTDVTGKTSESIDIAIRVNNTAPTVNDSVVTFGDKDNDDAYSTYANDGVPTVSVKIPLGSSMIITPYDFASDKNMTDFGVSAPEGGFTLNGLTGVYDPATQTLSTSDAKTDNNVTFNGIFDASKYGSAAYVSSLNTMLTALKAKTTVKKVSTTSSGTAATTATTANAEVYNDKLFFTRVSDGSSDAYTYDPQTADFYSVATDTTGFVSYVYGNKLKLGNVEYGLDFVMLTSVSRTTRPSSIDLVVRDRYGDSSDGTATFTVRIIIDVINTAPAVKQADRYQELAVSPIDKDGNVTLSSVTFGSNGNGSATGLMTDLDGDIPEFVLGSGVIVTNSKTTAEYLARHPSSFGSIREDHPELFTDDGTAGGRLLTEYIDAALASRYELTVTAKSSTKAIASGVYVCFIVDDGNGGTSMGYVRIEVLDTAPVFNTSVDTGFDKTDPLWSIKTTSTADIARDRYIVGSEYAWEMLEQERGATDTDIRLFATDADALHGKLVLSPKVTNETGYFYVNLEKPEDGGVISDDAYARAVPGVAAATGFTTNAAGAAAVVFLRTTNEDGSITDSAVLPRGFEVQMLYFVDGEWITKEQLITTQLHGKSLSEVSEYFDEEGRFIYPDWAFRMHATEGLPNDTRIGITLSVRDRAELGGDTAGIATAYASDRKSTVNVTGAIESTVYYSMSLTGIRTKDEYTRAYNDYYAVEYDASTAYVPTYDGDVTSRYESGVSNIMYYTADTINYLGVDGQGDTVLKARAAGSADGTKAGVNAGAAYSAATVGSLTGAYKYPSTIEIPTEGEVYIPMSYFGLLQSLVTGANDNGVYEYPEEYVGYDVASGVAYARGEIDEIASAITLSDGTTEWTGATLNDNPYIKIQAFDEYSKTGLTSSVKYFTGEAGQASLPYYNNRLSVLTVAQADDRLLGYEKNAGNIDSFIGNGRLMYLEEQATKLQEHNFGLVLEKTTMRTATRNITITVNLAKSKGNMTAVESDTEDKQTVTVSIHIANSKIDLSTGTDTVVQYDETKGTYYVDMTISSASSSTFALSRRADDGSVETISSDYKTAQKIAYEDADYGDGGAYRDRAYFYADSFKALSLWSYTRVAETDNGALVNTKTSERAQRSVLNYFGVASVQELESLDTSTYVPNPGMYGSTSNGGGEGYSSYFDASLTETGRVLNITASRKTTINKVALDHDLGNSYTQDQVKEYYLKRGLVAEYATPSVPASEPTRVYYPFKAIVYDSCGVGFGDGSYVGIEIRVTITNADPTLKAVGDEVLNNNGIVIGREYGINLAVGNSVTINLYDLVSDTDMYVQHTGNNYALSTRDYFERAVTGLDLETGDYLKSPYAFDEYLTGKKTYYADNVTSKDDGTYYRDGGGLSARGATDKDVVMWMETTGEGINEYTEPSSNNLSFTVNRRTTAIVGGKSVSIDEYRFTLKFHDSFDCATIEFTFVIHITNRAPTITANTRSFTMHSGDDLTVLAAYYDEFIGGEDGGTLAYNNSETKKLYDAHNAAIGTDTTKNGDGQNNATGSNYWRYTDITSEKADEVIYDSTVGRDASTKVHLGYLGLASDDTPWKMRIAEVSYYSGQGAKLWVENTNLVLATESAYGTEQRPLAINIRAVSACENEPVVITIADGDGGVVTTTLYITVISSPPIALDCADPSDKILVDAAGLEGETTNGGAYVTGTFRMFTVPGAEKAEMEVSGFDGVKTARRVYNIAMSSVAKDPDSSDETANMTLYGNGGFTVNGVALTQDNDGVYRAPYFEIRIGTGNRSFSLTATGYNAESISGYEELKFRIADYGNGDYANSLEITLHVYTLYSDMTNPTVAALDDRAYAKYLDGEKTINVKSYDSFYDAEVSVPSKYAYMSLKGNVGNDGNTESPVVDPDVAETGKQGYTARLYAFIDRTDSGVWKKLDSETLAGMFTRDGGADTFTLKADASAYMIGGVTYDGKIISANSAAMARLNAVNEYVSFGFTDNGSAIEFVPTAATLDNAEILLYIQVEKYLSDSRTCARTDAVLAAGTLFRLEVEDSAPKSVTAPDMPEGVDQAGGGVKGDIVSFKIYDEENPFGAMFSDSDRGDLVTVKSFSEADYEKALKTALLVEPELDWKATADKPRAFDITIDELTNTLAIKINRRMDSIENGKYKSSVSFPIEIEGYDKAGKTAKATIMLTIDNSEIGVKPEVEARFDNETGVGYSFATDGNGGYVINAQIKYSHPLEIELTDFIADVDYTTAKADSDSFAFVSSTESVYPYEYLVDGVQDVYYYETYDGVEINPDKRELLATVEPIGDALHRTGIRIAAAASLRTRTAKTYVRIVDRATDEKDVDKGVYITLNIIVMNDAPYVYDGKEVTNITMIGTESGTPDSMLFFIGDFVADYNNTDVTGDAASAQSDTYLRIFSQQPGMTNALYSTIYEAVDEMGSASLFTVTIPDSIPDELLRKRAEERAAQGLSPDKNDSTNRYNQWFVITPNAGYFGDGYVDITVADGDSNVMYDTLSASFRIQVRVVYDQNETEGAFNPVSLACGKSTTLDIGALMPELINKLITEGGSDVGIGAGDLFSQSEYYTLSSVELQNATDGIYAQLTRMGETGVWTLTAGNSVTQSPIRVNVKYTLNSDPTVEYSRYFMLNVTENAAPKIKYDEIEFVRYEHTGDIIRDLDESNTVRLEAWQLISDADDPDGSALKFLSVSSSVPSIVTATLTDDNRFLVINFAAKGRSTITVTVTDETGNPVELKFEAVNTDLPEGSLWLRFSAAFQSNMLMWILIFIGILLLLIILIIIIVVSRNRKRQREELEALLVSEMELEDQMLKLAGGDPSAPGPYRSYGYLPPMGGAPAQDPSMMLGAGESAPVPDNTLGLAPPPPDGTIPDANSDNDDANT